MTAQIPLFTGSITNIADTINQLVNAVNSQVQAVVISDQGQVHGPASATTSAVALFDGTSGKLLKNGVVIGTSAGNVVALDGSAKLPAVDGSLLTGISAGATSLAGLTVDCKTDYVTHLNMFLGSGSGAAITTGAHNTALGINTLHAITTATGNTAFGYLALATSVTDAYNTAIGDNALNACNGGISNTALGHAALQSVTTGGSNIGTGYNAGGNITTGTNNECFGYSAGGTISTGTYNTCVGDSADVSTGAAVNRTAVGNGAIAETDNAVYIGNDSVLNVFFGDDTAILHGDGSALINLPAGASELVLLATATASTSASLNFTSKITSSYSKYQLVFVDLVTSAASTLGIKTSTDNGGTWTQAMYSQLAHISESGTSAPTYTGVNNSTPVPLAAATGGGDTFNGWGTFTIGAAYMLLRNITAPVDGASPDELTMSVLAAVNAFQIIPSAGTLTSGKVYLYGVKNT